LSFGQIVLTRHVVSTRRYTDHASLLAGLRRARAPPPPPRPEHGDGGGSGSGGGGASAIVAPPSAWPVLGGSEAARWRAGAAVHGVPPPLASAATWDECDAEVM